MIDGRLYALTDGRSGFLSGLVRDKTHGLISRWSNDERSAVLFPSHEQALHMAAFVVDDPVEGILPTIVTVGHMRPL